MASQERHQEGSNDRADRKEAKRKAKAAARAAKEENRRERAKREKARADLAAESGRTTMVTCPWYKASDGLATSGLKSPT